MNIKQYEGRMCVCGHGKERHGIDYGMCKVTGCSCNGFRLDLKLKHESQSIRYGKVIQEVKKINDSHPI